MQFCKLDNVIITTSLILQYACIMLKFHSINFALRFLDEGVVAQWCNPLTLLPEQLGGVCLISGRPHYLSGVTKGHRRD